MAFATKYAQQCVAALVIAAFVGGLVLVGPVFAEEDSVKETVIAQIVRFIKAKNVRLQEDTLKRMATTVYEESQLYELDYRLILAVMKVESNFRNEVVSSRGARGLMQIKPALAKYIAKDAGVSWRDNNCLSEPEKNIKLGVYHLSQLMDDFKDMAVALHAYNTGPAKVKGKLFQENSEPKNKFARRVMSEYRSNISVLPDTE
jgi:soluble lytic murein transglycosylase